MPARLVEKAEFGTLELLIPSWERSLRAGNRSPRTIRAYGDSARLFESFAREKFGMAAVDKVGREHVESFMEDQLARWKPTTASVRYRSLQQFFRWLLDEGEIRVSPMERMKAPIVPEVPVPVVSDDDLRKLLKACETPKRKAGGEGAIFEDRRDEAVLRVFIDCGVRLAECASIRLDDVDFETDVIVVSGKGRRPRAVPFGSRTAAALDRYLRVRSRHPRADAPALWLGPKGGMTDSGLAQVLERRCALAGIPRIHPHQLRHTSAHTWMAAGGGETDAMRIFGWKSRTMLNRYGASAADERARDAHRRLALGDRL